MLRRLPAVILCGVVAFAAVVGWELVKEAFDDIRASPLTAAEYRAWAETPETKRCEALSGEIARQVASARIVSRFDSRESARCQEARVKALTPLQAANRSAILWSRLGVVAVTGLLIGTILRWARRRVVAHPPTP